MRDNRNLFYRRRDCGGRGCAGVDGSGKEGDPREHPDGGEEPEERDGDLAVVVRDAAGEEAGDVFVVEIEPRPAAVRGQAEAGRQRDGRILERGENVPRGGDREEDERGRDEVELPDQAELASDKEVEEDAAEGKTMPMKPLVRRLRAVTAANARQGRRDEWLVVSGKWSVGRRRSRAMRKVWTARVIQRATTMSGM